MILVGYSEENREIYVEESSVLVLPDDLFYLKDEAFKDNLKIEKVICNVGLEIIGSYAFYGCTNLKEVIFSDTLLEIKEYSFANTGIKGIKIVASLSRIGEHAFADCVNLETLIVDSTPYLCSYAFANCINLKNIIENGDIAFIGPYAFYNAKSLKDVTLYNVCYVYEYAFYGSGLINIHFNDCGNVYSYAFSHCDNLSNVIFDQRVRIYKNAFDDLEDKINNKIIQFDPEDRFEYVDKLQFDR